MMIMLFKGISQNIKEDDLYLKIEKIQLLQKDYDKVREEVANCEKLDPWV